MASKTRKCGNMGCNQFAHIHCTRCDNVEYCSVECQKTDWAVHKLSCGDDCFVSPIGRKCSNDVCTKEGTKQCSRCKSAYYCGAECQKGDWKQHKKECKPAEAQIATSVSGTNASFQQNREPAGDNKNVQTNDKCAICTNEGTKRCSGCRKVAYCSIECQTADWTVHKTTCKDLNKCPRDNPTTSRADDKKNRDSKQGELNLFNLLLGRKRSVAQEYLQKFSREADHAERIEREELVYSSTILSRKNGGAVLSDSDFTAPENLMKRWGSCFIDGSHVLEFLTAPGRKFGDIYERPNQEPYSPLVFQTMKNTSVGAQIYELGKTYVGFGFVDLFQLMWGTIAERSGASTLHFHGFDMSRIVTLRSKLIYGAMKYYQEGDVSTRSILQIWFSSCWERKTKSTFDLLVSDALGNPNKFHLDDNDVVLMKRWSKNAIKISKAKRDFSAKVFNAIFDPVWNLKYEHDRIYFCRYILTGIIFADEENLICGNPTMFTQYEWAKRLGPEIFSQSIDLKFPIFEEECNSTSYLYDLILKVTVKKAAQFRDRVFKGQIICHLETKLIDPQDLEFAKRIRDLDTFGIDWSNIQEYMERKSFIKFARACSTENTLHQARFINWIQYVYGACHVDWSNDQEQCLKLYREWKCAMENVKKNLGQNWWSKFIEGDEYVNPLNDVNAYLSEAFRSKFEDYFLADENGEPLNRAKQLMCDAIVNHFFIHSPTFFRSIFSFDRSLRLKPKIA